MGGHTIPSPINRKAIPATLRAKARNLEFDRLLARTTHNRIEPQNTERIKIVGEYLGSVSFPSPSVSSRTANETRMVGLARLTRNAEVNNRRSLGLEFGVEEKVVTVCLRSRTPI